MKQLSHNKKILQLEKYKALVNTIPNDPKSWANLYYTMMPPELVGYIDSLSYHYVGNTTSYSLILDVRPLNRIKLRTEVIFNKTNIFSVKSWYLPPGEYSIFTNDNCHYYQRQPLSLIIMEQYEAAKVFISRMILPGLSARDFLKKYKNNMKSPEYRFWLGIISLLFKSKKLQYESIEFSCCKDLSDEREVHCFVCSEKICTVYQKKTKKFNWSFCDMDGDESWNPSELIKIVKTLENEVD